MIVADLLKQYMFPGFRLIAGTGGLNRDVTSVSVIDAPDVDRWMRGGEFLVGSGYIFRDRASELIPFMERAAAKHVAAIGIKLDRYHHTLQKEITEAADSIGMPLIQLPLRYRWTDINEAVYGFLAREKERAATRSFDAVLEEGLDPKQLLSECAAKIGRAVSVVSSPLRLAHTFHPDGKVDAGEDALAPLRFPPLDEKPLTGGGDIAARLERRDTPLGQWTASYRIGRETSLAVHLWLSADEHTPSVRQERIVMRAITLLRASAVESAALAPDGALRAERFFEGLCFDIYNDPEIVMANLDEMGVTLPATSRVVIATPSDPEHEGRLSHWTPPDVPLSYVLGNLWTGLLPVKGKPVDAIGAQSGMYVAVGGVVRNALEIARSYQEASRTLGWVRDFSFPHGVYMHEELCLYALLESLSRLPEARSVWKRYWEPIETKGQRRRSLDIAELASCLVATDFNARACANLLHLHYNTVRNYIDELEHTLKLDLDDPRSRLGITLAFHIDKSYKGKR